MLYNSTHVRDWCCIQRTCTPLNELDISQRGHGSAGSYRPLVWRGETAGGSRDELTSDWPERRDSVAC